MRIVARKKRITRREFLVKAAGAAAALSVAGVALGTDSARAVGRKKATRKKATRKKATRKKATRKKATRKKASRTTD